MKTHVSTIPSKQCLWLPSSYCWQSPLSLSANWDSLTKASKLLPIHSCMASSILHGILASGHIKIAACAFSVLFKEAFIPLTDGKLVSQYNGILSDHFPQNTWSYHPSGQMDLNLTSWYTHTKCCFKII